jgi:hypothetical protein
VLAIAEGRACALCQQGSPPGGRVQEWHPRDPDPEEQQQGGAAARAASSDSRSFRGARCSLIGGGWGLRW